MGVRFVYLQTRRAGGVGWRLLGANHRELGRSPAGFADAERCAAAVERLRAAAVAGTPRLRRTEDGLWTWRLELDGLPVAVAARRYHRHRDCGASAATFVAAAGEAPGMPHRATPFTGPSPSVHHGAHSRSSGPV